MDLDNQPKSKKPDYGFILSQAGDNQYPRSNRKLIFIAAFVVMVVGIISIIFSMTKNNVKEVAKTDSVVARHLRLLSESNLIEAKKLFDDSDSIDEDTFDLGSKVYIDYFDLKKCQILAPDAGQEVNIVKVYCKYKKTDVSTTLVYTLNKEASYIVRIDYEQGVSNV